MRREEGAEEEVKDGAYLCVPIFSIPVCALISRVTH